MSITTWRLRRYNIECESLQPKNILPLGKRIFLIEIHEDFVRLQYGLQSLLHDIASWFQYALSLFTFIMRNKTKKQIEINER